MLHYSKLLKFGKLIQQLKQFGLDPSDWQIDEVAARDNVIHLRHRNDPSFSIAGHANLNATVPMWQNLYVTSV